MDLTLTNYWWLLIWLFVGGGFLYFLVPQRTEMILGEEKHRWYPFAALILILPFIIWAAYRSSGIGDTATYMRTFQDIPSGLSKMNSYYSSLTKDKGFYMVAFFFKNIISNDCRMFFLFLAIIQLGIMFLIYRKYSINYWLSLFLFIATGDYISFCFNGIRQFTAVSIFLASLPLIINKKYIKAIIVVLIAYTFHASAIIMLPVIFIVQGKAWNKKSIIFILLTLLVLIYVNQFTNLLNDSLSNTAYSHMVTDWKEWNDEGTNPIRVLIYSIPMILSLVGLSQIRSYDNNFINILVNFSIVTTGIALISMVTSGIFLGRLIVYPAMGSNLLLLPWEVNNLFEAKTTRLVKIVMIVGYLGLFYYQMHLTWGLL